MDSRQKLPTKKLGKHNLSADELFGNRQKLPAAIAAEIEKKNLIPRFVSVKRMQEAGGFHDKGWQVYQLDAGLTNPITGNVDKTYRVGDLILAVKTKEAHAAHKEHLRQKADAQSQVVVSQQSKQNIRDKIKESKAERYVQIDDKYDGDEEEENE